MLGPGRNETDVRALGFFGNAPVAQRLHMLYGSIPACGVGEAAGAGDVDVEADVPETQHLLR